MLLEVNRWDGYYIDARSSLAETQAKAVAEMQQGEDAITTAESETCGAWS